MKHLTPILIILLFPTTNINAQWQIQLDIENFAHLDRINFIDENYGWAIGGNTIGSASPHFFTEDGGDNWYLDPNWWPEDHWGTDILFVNQDTGFIAASNGIIHKTIDGGQNWTPIQTPATQNVIKLFFVDANNGWATLGQYSYGYILHTEDGGNNWELQNAFDNCYDAISEIYFLDYSLGWSAGLSYTVNEDYNAIKKTTNSGEEWITLDSTSSMYFGYLDIFFTDTLSGWIVGQKSTINEYLVLHTEDGGETWTEQTLAENSYGFPSIANCVFFTNDTVGWIGTGKPYPTHPFEGSVYLTTDGGANWNLQQEFYQGIFDIQMLDQDTGWAVGGDYVYHTTNGDTITITGLNENNIKEDFVILCPNPTTGIFSINTSNNHLTTSYQLLITNITGQTIYKLNSNTNQLLNNLTIDISIQPPGIYFITIIYSSYNQTNSLTKKIIKL